MFKEESKEGLCIFLPVFVHDSTEPSQKLLFHIVDRPFLQLAAGFRYEVPSSPAVGEMPMIKPED